MLKLLWVVAVLAVTGAPAMAQQPFAFTQMGYQQLVGPAAATFLTVPSGGAKIIEVCVSTQAIRYRDDGVAPTATIGIPVSAGTCFQYSGPLPLIQFIQQAPTATIDVSYYR
jgi:hypothetical protein